MREWDTVGRHRVKGSRGLRGKARPGTIGRNAFAERLIEKNQTRAERHGIDQNNKLNRNPHVKITNAELEQNVDLRLVLNYKSVCR